MLKLIKIFFLVTVPITAIVIIHAISKGKFYESFAMLELFPGRPAISIKESERIGYVYGASIPWPSLLKAQIKLLRNSNFHKIIYKNLPNELKVYVLKTTKGTLTYQYISQNFKINPVLDSNIIELYFYDKDKDKSEQFLTEIVNIYKKEREKFYSVKKNDIEKTFGEVEKLLLKKVEELSTDLRMSHKDSKNLPVEVITSRLNNLYITYYFLIGILYNAKELIEGKSIEEKLFSEKTLLDFKSVLEQTKKRYEEYVEKESEKLSNELSNAYINETYRKAIEELQKSFTQLLTEKYNRLIESVSSTATINVSIPVTGSKTPKFPNIFMKILGAIAIGFMVSLSYFVFFTKEGM